MMSDWVMNGLLGLMILVVLVSFWRFHQDPKYEKFNLVDIISKDGHPHRPAIQEFGIWLLMAWGFVVLMNRGTPPEWYVGIFVGAYVLRAAHAAHLSSRQNGPLNGKPPEAKP